MENRRRNRETSDNKDIKHPHLCKAVYWIILGAIEFFVLLGIKQEWPVYKESLSISFFKEKTVPEQTIKKNMDTVLLLLEENWKGLTLEERLRVMQVISDIEAHYLGLPYEITVEPQQMEETMKGYYSETIKKIRINEEYLKICTASEALWICCHEMYHCYQYRLVEAYEDADRDLKNLRLYRESVLYQEEFHNYIYGQENYEAYYNQHCEKDARTYAEEAVFDYYRRILEYQKELEKQSGTTNAEE